jgi:hypothetical protein
LCSCTTLTTALYPEGDAYLNSDAVFGMKKSLVVIRTSSFFRPRPRLSLSPSLILTFLVLVVVCVLQGLADVKDEAEARKRGFPGGGAFKLLQFDIVMTTEAEMRIGREKWATEHAVKVPSGN